MQLKTLKKEIVPPPEEGTGVLEAFTVLYAAPEGFRSPLTLSLIRAKGGERVMACNPDYRNPKEMRMGEKVHLSMREGLYVFERKNLWNRATSWWKKRKKSV